MSELKAVHAFDVYEAYTKTGDDDAAKVYLKSEADKVIADLEESHKMEVEQLLMEIAELKEKLKNSHNARKYWRKEYLIEYKECCHQKYKRCLAMAKLCEEDALWCYQALCTLPKGFKAMLHGKPVMIEPARLFNRQVHLTKCRWRWLELAEKFKDKESK